MQNTQPARRFSPIFVADVTINNPIVGGKTMKDVPFMKTPSATITKPDGSSIERTLMAFGNQLSEVESSLVEGATVKLAVQYDGGSVKIVGYPREKVAA